jgi:hypothetical protein
MAHPLLVHAPACARDGQQRRHDLCPAFAAFRKAATERVMTEPQRPRPVSHAHGRSVRGDEAMKGILLWAVGVPIPIIILLYLFVFN